MPGARLIGTGKSPRFRFRIDTNQPSGLEEGLLGKRGIGLSLFRLAGTTRSLGSKLDPKATRPPRVLAV